MRRITLAAAFAALVPVAALGQEAAGTLTVKIGDEVRTFVIVQGGEGPNPGSRYSRIGGDVVLTLVAVAGDRPVAPEEATETVELKFTAAETGAEVRSGSLFSYSTRNDEGVSSTRSGTTEVALDELVVEDEEMAASGTFAGQLPPDEQSPGTEVEGAFSATVKSRDATEP